MSSPQELRLIRVKRLRQLSDLLDNAIALPGTSYRIGVDPILGLFPGSGDLISSIFSAYIIVEGALLGLPTSALTRMIFNLLIDALLGAIPVLGDFFDIAWKCNEYNVDLIDAHVVNPNSNQKVNLWFFALLITILFLIIISIFAFSLFVITQILHLLNIQPFGL